MKAPLGILFAALVTLPLLAGRVPRQPAPDPTTDTIFTSYREVTRLTCDLDGSVRATTAGGVLQSGPDHTIWQATPTGTEQPVVAPRWHGKEITITPDGALRLGSAVLPFPPNSRGTHFTAVNTCGGEIVAALWGDAALYHSHVPGVWTREAIALSEGAGEQITALAVALNGPTWIGTRRAGLWKRTETGDPWQAIPASQSGPFGQDAQAMIRFHGDLYISTLEDGLVVRTADGWRHIAQGDLSGNAPRQMVIFQDTLYVRQGDGKVDRFDGSTWTRNVWAGQLPRKQVSTLVTDGHHLYVAQWGGWSVWDGAAWQHHLQTPGLQGLSITALLIEGDTLWIGTQGRGLAEADIATGAIRRWHDERRGMPDDWITSLARCGDRLYAGTFVGGLACLSRGVATWTIVPETAGENITDLLPLPDRTLYAATRHGVRHIADTGRGAATCSVPSRVAGSHIEAQTLYPGLSGDGLWVGTRTGVYFVRQ